LHQYIGGTDIAAPIYWCKQMGQQLAAGKAVLLGQLRHLLGEESNFSQMGQRLEKSWDS
jgi:hypothetical protein